MPLYEYSCNDCRTAFEVLQRMGAGADALECPSCGGGELSKLYSTFAAATGPSGSEPAAAGGCAAPACGTGSGFT